MPTKPAVASRPPVTASSPNSARIDGSAKPTRSTSAASAAHVTPQTASNRRWNRPYPISSIASWTVAIALVTPHEYP